jgi:hypothetical protein
MTVPQANSAACDPSVARPLKSRRGILAHLASKAIDVVVRKLVVPPAQCASSIASGASSLTQSPPHHLQCFVVLISNVTSSQPQQLSSNTSLDAARSKFLRALQDKEQRAHSVESSPAKPLSALASSHSDVVEVHDVPVLPVLPVLPSPHGQVSCVSADAVGMRGQQEGGNLGGAGLSVAAEFLFENGGAGGGHSLPN